MEAAVVPRGTALALDSEGECKIVLVVSARDAGLVAARWNDLMQHTLKVTIEPE